MRKLHNLNYLVFRLIQLEFTLHGPLHLIT